MREPVERRKRRIRQLCDLAKVYRRVNQEELARRLGRHTERLVPETANPKLDFLVKLSRTLDWPVPLVVSFVWGDEADDDGSPADDGAGGDFETHQAASRQAHAEGRYELAATLARRAARSARTPDERVIAAVREASALEGQGRYGDAMTVEQRGLAETSVSGAVRRQLESNLANAYYTLWALPEAESLSLKLVNWYRQHPPVTRKERRTEAFSLYVYGSTLRRMTTLDYDGGEVHAAGAEQALRKAHDLHRALARDYGGQWHDGIANTIVGALMQVEVTLGRRDPFEALREIQRGLEAVVDPSDALVGDQLESYAWWCIFGCYIAQRYVTDERLLQRYMAQFTDKADVIARRLGNWALRERVFTMEYASYERVERLTGRPGMLTLDDEDLEALVGVVGRFPSFGVTGMKLFNAHAASMRMAV